MHVRAAAGDFAQARRLEGVLHLDDAGHELSAADILAREADILETVIGEIPALMTCRALSLAVEQRKPAFGVFGNGLLVALDPGVERRAFGHDRPLVSRDGLGERLGLHAFIWKCGGEQRLVFADGGKPVHQLLDGHVHFARATGSGRAPVPRDWPAGRPT